MSDPAFEIQTHSLEGSWDAIWRNQWFERDLWRPGFRDAEDIRHLAAVASTVMPTEQYPRVLDCTCGLGRKTVALVEMGYEVEGSDASVDAVRLARRFFAEEGVDVPLRVARWDDLELAHPRAYDAVFSDAYDLAPTRVALKSAAEGLSAVLRPGGVFVFSGAHQGFTETERVEVLDAEWEALEPIEVTPPIEREGVKRTAIYIHERVAEGIQVTAVLLWEEADHTWAEIAKDWIRCFRWTFSDVQEALLDAGFKSVESVEIPGFPAQAPWIANVARR